MMTAGGMNDYDLLALQGEDTGIDLEEDEDSMTAADIAEQIMKLGEAARQCCLEIGSDPNDSGSVEVAERVQADIDAAISRYRFQEDEPANVGSFFDGGDRDEEGMADVD